MLRLHRELRVLNTPVIGEIVKHFCKWHDGLFNNKNFLAIRLNPSALHGLFTATYTDSSLGQYKKAIFIDLF
jgi:hypothetical protein